MPRHITIPSILLFLALGAAGCGYSSGSLVNPEYKTVAVPIFENATRYREFEFELTRAVVNQIEKKTHLKVVNNRNAADTILIGELVDFDPIVTVETTGDVVSQYRVVVVLNVKWRDRRTGKLLLDDPAFSKSADAALEAGETLRDARAEAFSDIAEKLVERMEMEW